MPRGPCWSQHEVGRLLAQIGGCRQVPLLMASTSRPNEALWRDIARRLSAEGYERSVSQCRAKWKKLKQSFYSDWAARRRGGGPALCSPGHYKVMKGLWKAAGRPVFGVRRLPDVGKREGTLERENSWAEEDQHSLLPVEPDCPEAETRPEGQTTWMERHPNALSQVHVYSLGMLEAKEEDDDEDEEMLRPSSATMPWDMRNSVEQEGLSCPGHAAYQDNAGTPPPPALHLVKSEPLTYTESAFSHLLSLKQESGDECSTLPADPELLPSLPVDESLLEDQVAGDLQGPAVVSLLQNMQQILAQLLHTSQQQQVLLESLASDTVSHLHLISDNLVHVGETLHELLIRVHNCDDIQ
ncbi:uncharacterized protein [Ambystoma mexicanum]|uniref:uncharacterized protein isoform X2 n=1 Tax=Ambystoma mexicanum TaxID=8296 RepID=UPI0037E7E4FE